MRRIPAWVVAGLCAEDAAAVAAWWSSLGEETIDGLLADWDAPVWPADITLCHTYPEVLREETERRWEYMLWRRQSAEYVLAHQETPWATGRGWVVVLPSLWRPFRRYRPDDSPVIPERLRHRVWQRSGANLERRRR